MRDRTGWIKQLCIPGEAGEMTGEYDRFACSWQGSDEDGFRIRYGPACASLDQAIAWTGAECRRAFLDGLGAQRWAIGVPREGFPELPAGASTLAARSVSWTAAGVTRWTVAVSLSLGFRDYEDAAPGFSLVLRELCEVKNVRYEDIGARLGANIVVEAPGEIEAEQLAIHLLRQAATHMPEGLRDEGGDALGGYVLTCAPR